MLRMRWPMCMSSSILPRAVSSTNGVGGFGGDVILGAKRHADRGGQQRRGIV